MAEIGEPGDETMGIRIRSATPVDAAQIAMVYLASRKRFLPFAPLAHSDQEVSDWVANELVPSDRVTVAESEDEIVGMMATSVVDGVSWLDHLYLHPRAVGQGVGSALLKVAKDILKSPIRLYTFQENLAARRFYERHDFHLVALSDGADNEEKCPDALYEFGGEPDGRRSGPLSCLRSSSVFSGQGRPS